MEENNKHRAGFEETDVNEIAVGKVGAALLLVTILAMAMLVGVFNYFKARDGGLAKTENPRSVFPQPQLEEKPAPELKAVRQSEDQILNTYGWVDQQKGVVRIPIDRAMDLLAERGLPKGKPEALPKKAVAP